MTHSLKRLKSTVVHKAAKAGAKHTAHGTASKVKLKRDPIRASTLLFAGGVLGALAGWLAARGTTAAPSPG
jgi:F0F1-type ATP synthase assembly protein I